MTGMTQQLISGPRALRPARSTARYLIAGALLMAASVAGFYFMTLSNKPAETKILVAKHAIQAGEAIDEADLSTATVVGRPSFAYVAERERSKVVGTFARIQLEPNTVLQATFYGDAGTLSSDQAIVSLALRRGQTPILAQGDSVALIGPGADREHPLKIGALVHSVDNTTAVDEVIIQFVVGRDSAATVALAGKQGQLTVVLLPRNG